MWLRMIIAYHSHRIADVLVDPLLGKAKVQYAVVSLSKTVYCPVQDCSGFALHNPICHALSLELEDVTG